ncbi:holo-ACP synthase [Lichenicola sp.]|uniref:holo-ACP synthase n=1 Tax=Lichenicola sp. TaxID=2804529 RepID=UPI003B00AA87
MMIGLGSDLCDIRRIERVLAMHGERFVVRCFTAVERAKAERRTEGLRAATYAKRWAAKEACAKALGTGFAEGVFHSDMGVVNLPGGQPTLHLTGGALTRLWRLMPAGHHPSLLLTMTDEPPYAFAQVLIQALPEGHSLG